MKRLEYEPELGFLAGLVAPGDTIVDIGANFGVYSLVMAQRAGVSGNVHAFEPGRASLEHLRENCQLNPSLNVEVIPVALSEHAGHLSLFHIGGGPATFSLGGAADDVAEQVQVTTLDAWARDEGLRKLDVLKIDVEGHEPKVFMGGAETLSALKPLVMFEVSASALARNGSKPDQSFNQLVKLGYGVHHLDEGQLKQLASAVDGNLFAIHPESSWSERLIA